MSCIITTTPTGPQSLQNPDGTTYDAAAAATAGTPGQTPKTVVQTLGAQVGSCVENPEPARTVNNFAINGGQLP